jgi:hypothetical protein
MTISSNRRRRLLLVVCALVALLVSNTRAAASTRVVPVSSDRYPAHSEPMLAENPDDPTELVGGSKLFTDPRQYRFVIGTYSSSDGGLTWSDNGPLPGFSAHGKTSDVSFAFAPGGGTVYACVLAVAGKASGVFVSRSTNGGRRWSSPATVFLDRSGKTFSDKPWIAVDTSHGPYRGRVYVAWNLDGPLAVGDQDAVGGRQAVRPSGTGGAPSGIAVARSANGGRTFSRPVIVSQFTRSEFALGAIPQIGPGGRLHVVFIRFHEEGAHPTYDLAMTGSGDGGRTFSGPHAIVRGVHALPGALPHGSFRNFTLPAFAVSPRSGTLIVAWSAMHDGSADILKMRSADGGRTWSLPSRANDDPPNDGVDQFQPQLAVSPDGVVVCSWFDRRYSKGDRLIDTVVAASRNDGRTFGVNVRVTPRSWNPAIGAPVSNARHHITFIGDYQGLTADDNAAHPFWNDTANGRSQQIRTASVLLGALDR